LLCLLAMTLKSLCLPYKPCSKKWKQFPRQTSGKQS
jgi:hypothetical protein